MKVAIANQTDTKETRVAGDPRTVKYLVSLGMDVCVQSGAGQASMIDDDAYAAAGATVAADKAALYADADLILAIGPPAGDVDLLASGAVLICVLRPIANADLTEQLAQKGVTTFALDMIPRTARAQSMDVLSSMASLAGYKAVLLAADELAKIIPMMMTAAGTIRPANVLIIGAGVAGLQAIATARRLGASVKAIDVRPAAAEQVESLGAKFIPMEVDHSQAETAGGYATDLGEEFYAGEQQIIAPHLAGCDIVITTALIPNLPAPILITEAMAESMNPGGVIVDLAAPAGGNCTLTQPGENVAHKHVKILGPLNLPAALAQHASELFSRNVEAFLKELLADGAVNIDMDNEIIRETLITRDGRIVHEPTLCAIERGRQPE